MKRFLAALLLAALMTVPAAAEEETAAIAQSTCSIVQSGDYYLVYCFAQVHNHGEQTLCLQDGRFELLGGEEVLATQELSQLWPHFIAPGQDGYFFDVVVFEPNEQGPVLPQVTGLRYDARYMTVEAQYASLPLGCQAHVEREETGGLYVVCELENTTKQDVFDPGAAFGLYAQSGALLYADGIILQGVGIPAGGKTLVRFEVDSDFVSQWDSYGVSAAGVQAAAWYRDAQD